jgi:hypothetical protein
MMTGQEEDGSLKDVESSCNSEELQDLVFQLRDAVKQIDKTLTE